MTVKELQPRSERARELLGDFWLNGEPVILSALQGSVVLLFFWDYTSAESIQCIPYVNEWSRRYASFGLVTVGIHTPRFAFTRDPQEVERAIAAFGVTFPVVLDNGGMIRGHYEAREWPHFVTIDRHSFIKAHFEGTTGVVGVERMIQALLYDLVPSNELPVPVEPLLERDREGVVCFRQTPEVHAGYVLGSLGNVEGLQPESTLMYEDPGIYMDGRLYLDGAWENRRECMIMRSDKGTALIEYNGVDVSGTMCAPSKQHVRVLVRQDDGFLTDDVKGEDVAIDRNGESYLDISEARLYRIARNAEFGHHTIRFDPMHEGFSLYSVSFGTAPVPELISGN